MDNLRVSYSSWGTFNSCPRKFEFYKLYKQPVSNFESVAMGVGTALHAAYQKFLETGDPHAGLFELGLAYPHHLCWDSGDDRSWEAAMATYFAMLDYASYDEWAIAEIKNHEGVTVPAIEVPFELVFDGVVLPDGRGLSLTGYIDCIMRRVGTVDDFRTLDIKTHRDRTRDRTANYEFNAQQIPYGIVIEHMLGKRIESFEVDYMDTFVDLLEPRVCNYSFTKDREVVDEWMFSTIMKIRELTTYMKMDLFPRTDHGCVSFFKPCSYMGVCATRNKEAAQEWILLDQEPAEPRPFTPWVTASIPVPEEML